MKGPPRHHYHKKPEAVLGQLWCEVHHPPLCLLFLHRNKMNGALYMTEVQDILRPPVCVYCILPILPLESFRGGGVPKCDRGLGQIFCLNHKLPQGAQTINGLRTIITFLTEKKVFGPWGALLWLPGGGEQINPWEINIHGRCIPFPLLVV